MKHPRLHLLDLPTLIPVLNQYGLLTMDDNYTLQNPYIPPLERSNALIYRMLPMKGSGAFKKFIKCLGEATQHSGHQEWIKILKCKYLLMYICNYSESSVNDLSVIIHAVSKSS